VSLTVLHGPPAAGKTTYARSQTGATHIDLDQLNTDSDSPVLGSTVRIGPTVRVPATEIDRMLMAAATLALRIGFIVGLTISALAPYASNSRHSMGAIVATPGRRYGADLAFDPMVASESLRCHRGPESR
jgi:hypothetical protein